MLSNILLKDLLFAFLFSNLVAPKRRQLRKHGEIAGTTVAMPAVGEPRRVVNPPADEHCVEGEVEEVASLPVAATEAAGASERPDEAGAQEGTVEPAPEGEASTRGANEPEAAAGTATTGAAESAPGG